MKTETTSFYLGLFQHIDLLLIHCVLIFLQEALTLVLHLDKKDQVATHTFVVEVLNSYLGYK